MGLDIGAGVYGSGIFWGARPQCRALKGFLEGCYGFMRLKGGFICSGPAAQGLGKVLSVVLGFNMP